MIFDGGIKTKVYVDVLVVLNIFINYFLLSGAALIVRIRPKRIRLVLGAFVGGAYSLVIFLPKLPTIVSIIMNIAASAIIVLISFNQKKVKVFLKDFAAFFSVNFIFAGLMLAVWIVFKPKGMVYNSGAVYFNIDVKTLVISTVGCYIILTLFEKVLKRNTPSDKLFDVTLYNKGSVVMTKALLDTGNSLSDGFSSSPVVIAEKDVVKRLFEKQIFDFIDGNTAYPLGENKTGIRIIPMGTVGGESVLRAGVIEKIEISDGKNKRELKNILLAESRSNFSSGEYSVLLGPKIFDTSEGKTENEHHKKTADKA